MLNKTSEQIKKLFIICDDIEGEALSTIVLNNVSGILDIIAVKAPETGEYRLALLDDITILTGAKVIKNDLKEELKENQLQIC